MPSGWATMYTGKFRNRALTTSPYSRKSVSMNGSGLRNKGNPLNGPRGPGTIRAPDFDGAVGCATAEGLVPVTCSADITILRSDLYCRARATAFNSTALDLASEPSAGATSKAACSD